MRLAKTTLAVSVSLALTACGGGGGGGGGGALGTPSNPYLRSSVPYYTPTSGGTFSVYASPSTKTAAIDVFTQDLNRDNVQEVVVGGRMSQSATAADHKDTMMQIYGWNTGSFARETSTWFAGTDNQITGTEPAVRFGDFNGDGNVDMFVAPSTDGILTTNSTGVAFLNTGASSFTRTNIAFNSQVWSHDAAVSDLNGDGYADIIVTDYGSDMHIALGSAAGTFTTHKISAGSATSASSVSVADYLGNGTKTLVLTDTNTSDTIDTRLYSWSVVGGELVLTKVADLPASRFYLAKWSTQLTAAGVAPHEIRNISMDFNGDGRPDIVVVSTLPNVAGGNSNHGYTEIQFLRNDGAGSFTDVTDTVLPSFNTDTFASYSPRLIDVNQDGLLDILLTAQDYIGSYDSSRVLLQGSDGKFKEAFASTFTDFYNQTRTMTAGSLQGGSEGINIAVGPNGDYYLISAVNVNDGTEIKSTVYAAKIGSAGTTSAQATIDAISTIWPYLTAVDANTVLAQTASSFINGIPVIDFTSALSPVGGLGITLDGRTGRRIELAGSISVPGMDRNLLNNLSAVDALGRHFQVNLSGMSQAASFMPVNFNQIDGQDVSMNWTSRLVEENQRRVNGMSFSGDDTNSRYAVSFTNRHFGDTGPWTYRFGAARIEGSPWFNFNGVFGQVETSTMLDVNATRAFGNNWFGQAGVIQTSTGFQRGLVQNITPLYSGYAVAGYQDSDLTLYSGLQPTIFAGHLDMKLPTSVDNNGVMHYTEHSVEIRNQAVMFAGFEQRWNKKNYDWKLSGVVNDQGQYQARLTYGMKF